jgi:hypothetical protein
LDEEVIHDRFDLDANAQREFLRSAMALSRSGAYSGFCTAAKIRLGFVVASSGLNSRIDSKSPVSATTLVNFLSSSS